MPFVPEGIRLFPGLQAQACTRMLVRHFSVVKLQMALRLCLCQPHEPARARKSEFMGSRALFEFCVAELGNALVRGVARLSMLMCPSTGLRSEGERALTARWFGAAKLSPASRLVRDCLAFAHQSMTSE